MGNKQPLKTTKYGGSKPGKIDALFNGELEAVEWGEFKIDDLFKVVGTESLDRNAINFIDTGVNFVGRTFANNGIQGKIKKQSFEPNEPFTITATVIGNYKYAKFQKEPYYCSQNINKLSPKSIIKKWNEKVPYYLMTSLQKFVSLYDGQHGGYKLEDIKNFIAQLPVKNNEIDFDFMESFIAKLEAERVADLESYLLVTGLKDYTLTAEEKQALDDFENLKFEDFNIVDVFDVKNTGNILARNIVENSGKVPYLCASTENNSVSSYITYDEKYLDKGNCVFIGGKTFVVTYQERDFYSNDSHNLVLYLKNKKRSRLNQLYLATCVNKSLGHKYSWGNSISNSKIKKDSISLPAKARQPNYVIMEILISAIQKLVIKDVVLFAEKLRNKKS